MIFGRRNAPPRTFYPETYTFLTSVGLPRQYLKSEISDYETNSDKFREIITNYHDNIHDMFQDCINITFTGANGVGKTFLGTIFLKQAFRMNYSVRRIIFSSFLNECFSFKEGEGNPSPLEGVITAEFLLLDEVGKEVDLKSCANITLLETILKKREELGFPNIICTNLTGDGILQKYGETIHSMIINQGVCVDIDAKDMRKDMLHTRTGYGILMGKEK